MSRTNEIIAGMSKLFPELSILPPAFASCFSRGGSHVQWESTWPAPCLAMTSNTGRLSFHIISSI
jgi:hypothetical protein